MRAAGVVLGVALALAPAFASAAAAEPAPVTVEGWWQTSAAGLPGAANPLVPTGGLDVAEGVLGPTALSALRVPVGSGGSVQVTLALAGTATTPTVALRACLTKTAWTPVAGGDLAAAPAVDCTTSVVGKVAAGTVTWAFGPGFVRDGFLDVALVPADGAQPFSAPFAAPGRTAVAVSPQQAPPPPVPDGRGTAPEPPAYVPVQPPTAALPGALSGSLAGPVSGPPPAPPAPPVVAAPSAAPSAAPPPVVAGSAGRAEGPVPHGVAWALLAALVLAASATALRQRVVVSDEAPVRGVGRFARPQPEPAPRL
jgi:hypothetical protein